MYVLDSFFRSYWKISIKHFWKTFSQKIYFSFFTKKFFCYFFLLKKIPFSKFQSFLAIMQSKSLDFSASNDVLHKVENLNFLETRSEDSITLKIDEKNLLESNILFQLIMSIHLSKVPLIAYRLIQKNLLYLSGQKIKAISHFLLNMNLIRRSPLNSI